ncbi:MAG: hypothetical protein V1658_00380 [Candidatus Micrarchaeota archaeon]
MARKPAPSHKQAQARKPLHHLFTRKKLDAKQAGERESREKNKHEPPIIPPLNIPDFKPAAYPKSEFHSYKKMPPLDRLSKYAQSRGMPPLPIIGITLLVIIAAILPIFSVGVYTFEMKEADVSIAIMLPDGSVLKDAEILLLSPENYKPNYASPIGADGLAEFRKLPVNGKFIIYAETDADARRVDVYDRDFIVPYPERKKYIIIVKNAVQ